MILLESKPAAFLSVQVMFISAELSKWEDMRPEGSILDDSESVKRCTPSHGTN